MLFKMKKIMLLMAGALCAVAMNAQSVSGGRDGDREVSKGWNTIYAEWNPTTAYYTGKGDLEDVNYNGFSLGYNRAISLATSIPLYLETGLAAQFTFKSETDEDEGYGWSDKETTSVRMLSLKVPVNFLYVWSIPNTRVDLIPFLGMNLRGNVWGQAKQSEEVHNSNSGDYSKSKSYNIFDKKDVEKMGYDEAAKRFQLGWQIGVKARILDRLIVGGSFGTDFMEIDKKIKFRNGTIMLGYTF